MIPHARLLLACLGFVTGALLLGGWVALLGEWRLEHRAKMTE